jgi:hypothetical protein
VTFPPRFRFRKRRRNILSAPIAGAAGDRSVRSRRRSCQRASGSPLCRRPWDGSGAVATTDATSPGDHHEAHPYREAAAAACQPIAGGPSTRSPRPRHPSSQGRPRRHQPGRGGYVKLRPAWPRSPMTRRSESRPEAALVDLGPVEDRLCQPSPARAVSRTPSPHLTPSTACALPCSRILPFGAQDRGSSSTVQDAHLRGDRP